MHICLRFSAYCPSPDESLVSQEVDKLGDPGAFTESLLAYKVEETL